MAKVIERYGARWAAGDSVRIEMACIRRGGRWLDGTRECGAGLAHHYKRFSELVWPGDWWTRWDDLMVEHFTGSGAHSVIGVSGPASSSKTHRFACYGLTTYWCFPGKCTVLCSTTTREDLEMRIWGEVKKYFSKARERYPWLPGHLIESKQMITTDGKEVEGREFRNGLKGVACKSGGRWQGLGPYIGVKNDRVLLLADEGQMMEPGFFDAQGNLASNPWSQLLAGGNPNSCDNPFGKLCEPVNGWESVQQGEKTQTWETRHGICINLVGVDSPNLDYEEGAEPFGKLIGRRYIKKIAHDYGTDSWQYQAWVLARFPVGALERRVITRALCRKFHAQDEPVWGDGSLLKLFSLDAAYGGVGGDRCVGVELHVGKGIDGVRRIACAGQPVLIPVNNTKPQLPEEQIVEFVRGYCEPKGIEPQNVAFDGTGRASLMSAFARLWSPAVVAVEFGGRASERPVRIGDAKLCSEAYDRFVTELWFTCRVCVEADQIRGLPESIVEEFQMRAWVELKTGKVSVEIKSETKDRLGKSPDLADAFVTGVELARRRGFEIAKLGAKGLRSDNKWLRDMREKFEKASKAHELSYS